MTRPDNEPLAPDLLLHRLGKTTCKERWVALEPAIEGGEQNQRQRQPVDVS